MAFITKGSENVSRGPDNCPVYHLKVKIKKQTESKDQPTSMKEMTLNPRQSPKRPPSDERKSTQVIRALRSISIHNKIGYCALNVTFDPE